MNPFIEEAERLLRLARKDRLACKLLLPVEELASSVASFHAQQAAKKALEPILEYSLVRLDVKAWLLSALMSSALLLADHHLHR